MYWLEAEQILLRDLWVSFFLPVWTVDAVRCTLCNMFLLFFSSVVVITSHALKIGVTSSTTVMLAGDCITEDLDFFLSRIYC